MPKRSKQELLSAYAGLVRRWATRVDLVAPGDLADLETRHIEDSLRLSPLVAGLPPGPCADVGSGAGFPGIPLAIAHPERRWRLIEPRSRRAAFLEDVVRELDLNCEVVPQPVENAIATGGARSHSLAVARALAAPQRALAMIEPLVQAGGVAAVFVGERADIPAQAELWADGVAIVRVE